MGHFPPFSAEVLDTGYARCISSETYALLRPSESTADVLVESLAFEVSPDLHRWHALTAFWPASASHRRLRPRGNYVACMRGRNL